MNLIFGPFMKGASAAELMEAVAAWKDGTGGESEIRLMFCSARDRRV